MTPPPTHAQTGSLEAEVVTLRGALRLFRVQQLSTADTKRQFLAALSSTVEYQGKVVVDREDYEQLLERLESNGCCECEPEAGIVRCWDCLMIDKLTALRTQGGER